jgi:hypothetical protein
MNDLLWLVNHQLRGNIVGILTSQNPDTPEGLESRFSIRIVHEHPFVSYCSWTSFRVKLFMNTPGFGHNYDMYGFWSIWCFFIIRCSCNGRSTKLMELVSNKHLSSISWMEYRYVGGKYMHFMTVNIDACAHTVFIRSSVLRCKPANLLSLGFEAQTKKPS